MSIAHGERVTFDFDSGDIGSVGPSQGDAPPPASAGFIGEILERNSDTANPPSAPSFKPNTTGFPAHKKRTARVSAFKQQRAEKNDTSLASEKQQAPKPTTPPAFNPEGGHSFEQDERRQIDKENRQRIAAMSEAEIEQEQKELLAALSPSLVQRLLARSNIDEGSNEQDWNAPAKAPPAQTTNIPDTEPRSEPPIEAPSKPLNDKKVSFDLPAEPSAPSKPTTSTTNEPSQATDVPPSTQPTDSLPPSGDSIHFPSAPQPPDLDPADPNFLTDLKDKYFPSLAHDPSSLSWMTPLDPTDTSSPYHPSQTALNASELRFDFKGALLAPGVARSISVDKGLHHHAEAPEAAGYTIPELARLARSAVPAQRCMAYQTLGRILYRLGRGEFGTERESHPQPNGPVKVAIDPMQVPDGKEELEIADEPEDAAAAMATGLWKCVEEGKVIESLSEEASKERGHLTAISYAQEAHWNWQRGGGRERRRTKAI